MIVYIYIYNIYPHSYVTLPKGYVSKKSGPHRKPDTLLPWSPDLCPGKLNDTIAMGNGAFIEDVPEKKGAIFKS